MLKLFAMTYKIYLVLIQKINFEYFRQHQSLLIWSFGGRVEPLGLCIKNIKAGLKNIENKK